MWTAPVRKGGIDQETVRVAGKIIWADRPEDLIQHLPRPQDLSPGVELPEPISVTFIPAYMTTGPCWRSTRNTLRDCCHCPCSSASGCSAAIGRSGRQPASISSANDVPSQLPPRRNCTLLPATIGRTYNDENTLVMPPVK